MKKRITRAYYKNEIMKSIFALMENEQMIPLSNTNSHIEGIGEVAKQTITKERGKYILHIFDEQNLEYRSKIINKKIALDMLQKQFHLMNKEKLKDELGYWKDCAEFFEEEQENMLFFSTAIEK